MTNPKRVGVCAHCGREVTIRARGLCAPCYEVVRLGKPVIDCFAKKVTHRAQCAVMAGGCRLMAGGKCPFHKTKAEYASGIIKARQRIAGLPEPLRAKIVQKYYVGANT